VAQPLGPGITNCNLLKRRDIYNLDSKSLKFYTDRVIKQRRH
jgi:hypothetical protein